MITEEDIKVLKEEIWKGHKKNPKAMFAAFCLVLVDYVLAEYKSFVNGLDELNEKDRLTILKGMFEKHSKFWEHADTEEAYDMSIKILEEYSKQVKKPKRRGRSK